MKPKQYEPMTIIEYINETWPTLLVNVEISVDAHGRTIPTTQCSILYTAQNRFPYKVQVDVMLGWETKEVKTCSHLFRMVFEIPSHTLK